MYKPVPVLLFRCPAPCAAAKAPPMAWKKNTLMPEFSNKAYNFIKNSTGGNFSKELTGQISITTSISVQ